MTDYEPLEIGGVCNAGPSLLADEHVETGPQRFLGIPFLIGGGGAGESCFIKLSGSSGAVTVPIGTAGARAGVRPPAVEVRSSQGRPP